MIRKTLIILVVIVVAGLGVLAVNIQRPHFWEQLLLKALNHRWPGVVVKEMHFDDVRVTADGQALFSKGRFKLKIGQASYFISTGDLRLGHLWELLKPNGRVSVAVDHVAIVSDGVNVSDLNFNGQAFVHVLSFDHLDGCLTSSLLEYQRYQVTCSLANVSAGLKQAVFNDTTGSFYGGHLNGVIVVDYGPQIPYSIHLQVTDVDLSQLARVNEAVFGSTRGIVQGHMEVVGEGQRLKQMHMQFDVPKGGSVKASLLAYLAQYIPQKAQLEALIKSNADVPLDIAQVLVTGGGDQPIAAKVKMLSSSLSLDINVDIDVNIDQRRGQ